MPIIGVVNGDGRIRWGDEFGSVPRPAGDLPLNLAAIQCRTAGTDLDYMDRWLLFVPEPHDTGTISDVRPPRAPVRGVTN